MEPKHFNLLVVASIVSLLAAGVVHGAYNDWSTEKVSGEKLFDGFDDDANTVESVRLTKGQRTLTLKKTSGDGWVLAERANYPVKTDAVRKLLVSLAQAELVEPKTKVESKYPLLELGDPSKEGAKSVRVTASDGDGKAVADVVLGKRKVAAFGKGQAGTYVRRPDDPQSWLANANIAAKLDVSSWVDPVFFRIDPKSVTSLSVTAPKAQPILVVAEDREKPTFKIANVPSGSKLRSKSAPTEMVTSLKTLELLDVHKIKELPMGDKVHAAMLETAGGTKIDMRLRSADSDRWISMKVVAEGSDKDLAKRITEQTSGWEFKVADWRARQTFKSPKDLFEVDEAAKAAKAAPSTPPPDPAAGPARGDGQPKAE